MLKNYYFYKWRDILRELKDVTDLDLQFQESRALELQLCRAAQTLTAMLARYMRLRNALLTTVHHNLQVQKTEYMQAIADAVDNRIAELKSALSKLECSNNRFFTNGLLAYKLTPQDIEPTDIKHLEENEIHDTIKDIFEKIRIKREIGSIESTSLDEEEVEKNLEEDLVEEEDKDKPRGKLNFDEMYAVKEVIPPEVLEMRYMVNLIKAHEKTRKTLEVVIQSRQKRVIWEKDLLGILNPPAPIHIRERASAMIKSVARAYFQYKRDRITNLKREEKLQMLFLKKPDEIKSENNEEEIEKVHEKANSYEIERQYVHEQMKQAYLQRKRGDLVDDHKDFLRTWFQKWHKELRFFYDIPKNGGSILILREDVPEPHEWKERYDAYIIEKKANKNKTKLQLKQEKQQALKAEKLQKQYEKSMNKKNNKKGIPMGYTYPKSTTLEEVQKALQVYHREWDEYDVNETPDAKEKFVKERVKISMLEGVKMQTCLDVDPDMTIELKSLWKALKSDYEKIYEEAMPEKIVERKAKQKRQKKKGPKHTATDTTMEFLEILIEHGLLVQYQKRKFKDFVGDHNFAGNEIRCLNRLAQPLAGELRQVWWNICQDAKSGFRRILLLGPKGSGRTTLVYILASSLNAVLLEINPEEIQTRPLFSAAYLQVLMKSVVACLKTVRPLVVYIKNIQVVFPKKAQREAKANARILNNNLIKKLFKMNKSENVIIIGSLSEPWSCRSGQIMKRFPEILLMPDTTYSATDQLLKDWILNNRTIPPDFPTHSLAQALRGLQYGFLKNALNNFLTGERLIKIAAFGLTPSEVFDFVMESAVEVGGALTDYDQYCTWYQENTPWGKKETSLIQEQRELKEQLRNLELKKKQKKDKNKMADNMSELQSILEED